MTTSRGRALIAAPGWAVAPAITRSCRWAAGDRLDQAAGIPARLLCSPVSRHRRPPPS